MNNRTYKKEDFRRMLALGKASKETTEKVLSFIDFCDEVIVLVERENNILFEKGFLNFDQSTLNKVKLLEMFDLHAVSVFSHVKESAKDNVALCAGLISKVTHIKKALEVNTTMQLECMKSMYERIPGLRDRIMESIERAERTDNPEDRNHPCH